MANEKIRIIYVIGGYIETIHKWNERLKELLKIAKVLGSEYYLSVLLDVDDLTIDLLEYLAMCRQWTNNKDRSIDEHRIFQKSTMEHSGKIALQINRVENTLTRNIVVAYVRNCIVHWRESINAPVNDISLLLPEVNKNFKDTILLQKLHEFASKQVLKTHWNRIDMYRVQHAEELLRLRMVISTTESEYFETVEHLFDDLMDEGAGNFNWACFSMILMILTNIICRLIESVDMDQLRLKTGQLIAKAVEKFKPFLGFDNINGMMSRATSSWNKVPVDAPDLQLSESEKVQYIQRLHSCNTPQFRGIR